MKSFASALLVLAPVAGIAALVGCAEGSEADPAESFLASSTVDAGTDDDDDEDDSVKIPAPSNPPDDEDDEDDEDDDGDDAGAGDAGAGGSDAGADSGKPDSGGGGGGACASTNTCAGSTNLGQISGDTGAGVLTRSGHTSQWFQVRVTEDDNSIDGRPLRMRATLASPPGTNYDLYLYVPGSDTIACSAVTHQSTSAAATDTASAQFGEGGFLANGSSDDRTVTVEVRHVSGTCDPAQKWTLTVEGNK